MILKRCFMELLFLVGEIFTYSYYLGPNYGIDKRKVKKKNTKFLSL